MQRDQGVHVKIRDRPSDQGQHRHGPDRGPPDPQVLPPGHASSPASAKSPDSSHWLLGGLAPPTRPPAQGPGLGRLARGERSKKLHIPYLAGSRMGAARHWQTRPDAVIALAPPPLSCGNDHTHYVCRPACSVRIEGVRRSNPLSSTESPQVSGCAHQSSQDDARDGRLPAVMPRSRA
jgi:hypothetical protein